MVIDNKKYLFVAGCSHLAGSEIEGAGKTERSVGSLSKAFPGKFAETFKLNYINSAVPGGSNEFIYRSTIEFAVNWVHQGRDPKDLLIMIGWSTDERIEFTWQGEHFHWANGCDWKPFYKDGTGPNFQNWFKALQLYYTDFDFGRYRRIINIITLDRTLKSLGIDYIQFSSCAKMDEAMWNSFSWKHMKDIFPFDTFFEPYDSFIDQYRYEYPENFSDWLHADESIHDMYLEKLINHVREL